MNITQIINKVLSVSSIAKTPIHSARFGALGAGTESILLDTTKPVFIDYIEWSCNDKTDIKLDIQTTISGGVNTNILVIPSIDGGSIINATRPHYILENYSGIWDILEYNESQSVFKFRLRLKNLEFSKGVKISVSNTGSVSRNVAVLVYGRE